MLHLVTNTAGNDALAKSDCYTIQERLPLDQIFTQREVRLVKHLQGYCREARGRPAKDVRAMLDSGIRGLAAMAMYLSSSPSLWGRTSLGGNERSGATLMNKLLEAEEHALEWSLPTKAALSRSFGIAKVNFWASLRYALEGRKTKDTHSLRTRLGEAMEEAVYTRLAEELYASFITARTIGRNVRRAAIRHVVDLWEGRAGFTTNRLCPILRSAWAARCRTPRAFGTMLGTSEVATLLLQDCDPRFVDWFSSKEHQSEELHAFEEFLFDLPSESIAKVRTQLQEEGRAAVGPDEVARYLGSPRGGLRPLIEDARALYSSFRRRRVQAQYRTSTCVPGPKRTAESYLLEALLVERGTGPEERAGASAPR